MSSAIKLIKEEIDLYQDRLSKEGPHDPIMESILKGWLGGLYAALDIVQEEEKKCLPQP